MSSAPREAKWTSRPRIWAGQSALMHRATASSASRTISSPNAGHALGGVIVAFDNGAIDLVVERVPSRLERVRISLGKVRLLQALRFRRYAQPCRAKKFERLPVGRKLDSVRANETVKQNVHWPRS